MFFLASFCLLFIRPCHPEEKKPFWSKFSLKVSAGWGSRIPIGDVNDCLKSFNDNEVFEAHRDVGTGQVVGEIKTLDDRIFHGEAELRFDLTPRISFGIATSLPIHKRNESSVTYTYIGYAGPQIMTWTFKSEIKVSPPIRLSAYYTLPVINRLSISIGGGLDLNPARVSQFLRYAETPPVGVSDWYTWDQEAKRNLAIGVHGNAVLKYLLNDRLALVAEFQYRHIKMTGLKGTLKHENYYGDKSEESGTLYYFTEWNYFIGTRHATLEIFETPPEGGVRWINDLREAALDLSGYSIRMGINVRLF
ncbi:MAG: hypothetical protein A2V45_06325 [Candidatus Aminicenantes bacterium RBG_19FT_COMBO_58_17]|nr:MAG: hypothetical protein A2V45_06325 [Candidatus Aminicenantes bacterium RBG_19FT_COMBO_58_17]